MKWHRKREDSCRTEATAKEDKRRKNKKAKETDSNDVYIVINREKGPEHIWISLRLTFRKETNFFTVGQVIMCYHNNRISDYVIVGQSYMTDIYIWTHTHTHTHIYIYVCVCVCKQVLINISDQEGSIIFFMKLSWFPLKEC